MCELQTSAVYEVVNDPNFVLPQNQDASWIKFMHLFTSWIALVSEQWRWILKIFSYDPWGIYLFIPIFPDSLGLARLQEQLRESKAKLDKERSARTTLENKYKSIEKKRSELAQKLEEVTRAKSSSEQAKIDLESRFRTLQYKFSEETNKAHSVQLLYDTTMEQLKKKEDQLNEWVPTAKKYII